MKRRSFVDFDLAQLKDSKGGFIAENEEGQQQLDDNGSNFGNKQKKPKSTVIYEHLLGQQECCECSSPSVNTQYQTVYKCLVCNDCVQKMPDKYSLLTKTECRQDYLLTDEELESLTYMERQNPHKASYSRMKLYMRFLVEEFALKKWKTWEALDEEFAQRSKRKQDLKDRKFKEKLTELRRRTMTARIEKARSTLEHVHEFIKDDDHESKQRCRTCGFSVDVDEF